MAQRYAQNSAAGDPASFTALRFPGLANLARQRIEAKASSRRYRHLYRRPGDKRSPQTTSALHDGKKILAIDRGCPRCRAPQLVERLTEPTLSDGH